MIETLKRFNPRSFSDWAGVIVTVFCIYAYIHYLFEEDLVFPIMKAVGFLLMVSVIWFGVMIGLSETSR